MMNKLAIVFSDFLGLTRTVGLPTALRWLFALAVNFPAIARARNLQAADRHLGPGPFKVKLPKYGVSFSVSGPGAISGIREMHVRDAYFCGGLLRIADGDTVVDLGANMGNFTNLALSFGQAVRVVAVEPSSGLNSVFQKSVGLNDGYLKRTQLVRGFLGKKSDKQEGIIEQDSNYSDAPWISEDELIERGELETVDFLKCDIEGGEFGFLQRGSKLLTMTRSLAVEIHAFAGNVDEFISHIGACGFNVMHVKRDPSGTATVLAKRP